MTIPLPGQTVHMMTWRGVLCEVRKLHRNEGRNVRELALYTTDDLRHLYQGTKGDLIHLQDGIVSRTELVAAIRWRVLWAQIGYFLLLAVSLASACFALLAWRDPVPAPALPTVAAPVQIAPSR